MRKPKGVKPLDLRVPPIHHQNSPITSLHNQGKLKKDLQTNDVVDISSITELLKPSAKDQYTSK